MWYLCVTLNVTTITIHFLVYKPVNIFATPQIQTASIGGLASFNCSSSNTDLIIWIKGENTLISSSPPLNVTHVLNSLMNVVSSNSSLNLMNITSSSTGGNYTCIAINEAGFDNITVNLYISPIVVQQPIDHIVDLGQDVILTCLGDSFPPPFYTWERFNTDTNQFQTLDNETSNQLTFMSVDYDDFGTYRCIIETPVINESVSAVSVVIIGEL